MRLLVHTQKEINGLITKINKILEIKKISEKYNFYQDGASYVVYFGAVKRYEDKIASIQISGVEDSEKLSIKTTCGCTTLEKEIVDKTTAIFKLKYNDCEQSFAKVNVLKYNGNQITTIILKGGCQ